MTEVDFAYEEGKPVLHDVSVYAEPGQKVAFVGATGAGKTTITNLINRFYNMLSQLEDKPHITGIAHEAIREACGFCQVVPIRGGTDGAQLSFSFSSSSFSLIASSLFSLSFGAYSVQGE